MKTDDNLKAAFAGESQANRKYLAFARQAEKDGFPQVARLFRAVAAAETVHAHAHLRALGGIRSTAENLEEAIAGEHYEFTEMYPEFIRIAEEEENTRAKRGMSLANEVEKVHHGLYESALTAVKEGQDLAEQPVYVCAVCGHTVIGEAPDVCPICGAPHGKYDEIS
jgi:rubrerythrin